MNKSRFVLALVFMIFLLLTTVAIVSGGQEKVAVCHITGTHDFGDGLGEVPIGHVITIADPAYQSHLDHGDPEVWEIVTMPDGSEVCCPGDATKIVFVTSLAYSGNLGGLDGADRICNQLSSEAGLMGIYKAWLSTVDTSVNARFSRSNGPYILPDGTLIAEGWVDLTDCDDLTNPINMDENGIPVIQQPYVWTNTMCNAENFMDNRDCNGWTSNDTEIWGWVGCLEHTDPMWTACDDSRCNLQLRLICIQQ